MWPSNSQVTNMSMMAGRYSLVAVAIDKDKNSQNALKWAIDNLLTKGQSVILIHILRVTSSVPINRSYSIPDPNGALIAQKRALDDRIKEIFLTFHCFCARKDIQCFDVILEDTDIAKGITEYVAHTAIENLVLGASHHGFIKRLKTVDVPTQVSKLAPDFCTVYVISKSKISSMRNACRRAPFISPLRPYIDLMEEQALAISQSQSNSFTMSPSARQGHCPSMIKDQKPKGTVDDTIISKSSSLKGRSYNGRLLADFTAGDSDISFVSSNRPSKDVTTPGILFDTTESSRNSMVSTSSDSSLGSGFTGPKGSTVSSFNTDFSSCGDADDSEAEMRRLKLELQRTMEMYSTACKEALNAKQTAVELNQWRKEEERRLEEARLLEEAARLSEQGKAKYRSAMQNSYRSGMESGISVNNETTSSQKSNGDDLSTLQLRYRKYTIEDIEEATEYFAAARKIAEGGYGPVFRCYLDHTPAAVKVLRPGATQGRAQFQQEIEVLSCMRHPHMVLLLGACPEYGCLVYEYMSNGSLEFQLARKGGTPALSWQTRFRIAAEVATGLNFLHMTKPEPLVHRDLKPANILLDHNFVSKIGDVGLARMIPTDEEIDYCMTAAAGTFCYIDPEYQQTGMLGVKSDVYSFGIVLLQLLTAKPAMGLTYYVEEAIENGTFEDMLDPSVPDWPVEESLNMAKLALQCSELRKRDRPDLGKVVLPELCRLREFAEENMNPFGSVFAAPRIGLSNEL